MTQRDTRGNRKVSQHDVLKRVRFDNDKFDVMGIRTEHIEVEILDT